MKHIFYFLFVLSFCLISCDDQENLSNNSNNINCGNGKIENGEICDGTDFGSISSCDDIQGYSGTAIPVCDQNCTLILTPCTQDSTGDTCNDWSCDEEFFDADDGCDCNCGCWDPDCDDPESEIYGCETGQICEKPSTCATGTQICDGWSCDPAYYNIGDDCDCNCGCWDPDCDDSSLSVYGCSSGETCEQPSTCIEINECRNNNLQCGMENTIELCEANIWVSYNCNTLCIDAGFDYTTGCAFDTENNDEVCYCAYTNEVCAEWTCETSWYGTNNGCNCNCGCWDPDCDNNSANVKGCTVDESCIKPGICTRCPNQPVYYGCPLLESEVISSPDYCSAPDDSGAFDHIGNCYREIPSTGDLGQQCCYSSGQDNCTGSPDLIAPASGKESNGECEWDFKKAIDHCAADVVPFCNLNCSTQYCAGIFGFNCDERTTPSSCIEKFGCDWEYHDCGGDLPTGGTWSEAECDCGFWGDIVEAE
jgi:hypothetical protein